MFEQFTLGIEEEFQIVDPQTRELRSHVTAFLEEGKMLLGEQIKPEMIQSMIEVGTGICKNIKEARTDITNLRGIISGLARKNNLEIVAASTHPISHWRDQKIFEDERYELLVEELQTVARSLPIFGGIKDTNSGIWQDYTTEARILRVWQNHGLQLDRLPEGFQLLATAYLCRTQMMVKRTEGQLIYTVQFHLEKSFEDWNRTRATRWEHPNESRDGRIIFENFLRESLKHVGESD